MICSPTFVVLTWRWGGVPGQTQWRDDRVTWGPDIKRTPYLPYTAISTTLHHHTLPPWPSHHLDLGLWPSLFTNPSLHHEHSLTMVWSNTMFGST